MQILNTTHPSFRRVLSRRAGFCSLFTHLIIDYY
nr:MAG TPA: hypothetical protein [Caudoviricetes sp.]